jgi:choline dehydrogenase-like flavoprotein
MPIYDLATAEDHATKVKAGICIIGGGMAGLVLAQRLARGGMSVAVLESGGLAFDAATHEFNVVENVTGRYGGALTSRFRGLGGSSSRWGGRTIPISPHETVDRDFIEQEGWPFPLAALDRYNGEIENIFALDHTSYDEIAGSGIFAANDPDYCTRWAKWPAFKDLNLSNVMRSQLQGEARLELWLHATATGFDLDRDKGAVRAVTARHASGRNITITADHFVIAGGTIETTRLLLWLKRLSDDRAFSGSPALGRYFQDHLNLKAAKISRANPSLSNRLFGYRFSNGIRRSLHFQLSERAQKADQVYSAFAYVSMEMGGTSLGHVKSVARDFQRGKIDVAKIAGLSRHTGFIGRSLYWRYAHQQLYVPDDVDFQVEFCAEQRPDWSNHIALSENLDSFGVPMARIDWRPMPADAKTLHSAARHLDAYWRRSGLEDLAPLQWSQAVTDPNKSITDGVVDYFHPSGTTRMGTDAAQSVLTPDLTCHDVPNLSVISASAFPAAGSANPTFTIMRMALRLADHLQTRHAA